ncbi:MAG: hypothetical protein H3C31_10780 [Brumimicrobium sp.]|nr:hypothetical protein [Brumimicrobium sp.]MCO5267283.1 hypothetical protein [Brumimicrobium sp.]
MKKKNLFIALFSTMALLSCKKDYSCTCTVKYVDSGSVYTEETNLTIEGANKTQAIAACNEATIKQVWGPNDSYEQTCKLKK